MRLTALLFDPPGRAPHPSVCNRAKKWMLQRTVRLLKGNPFAKVKFPENVKMREYADMIKAREPLADDVVGTLQNGYIRNVPLPRAPWIQSASHMTSHVAITREDVPDPGTYYLQDPRAPTCSNLGRSLRGLSRRGLLLLFPCWLM
jgi:hypothetical protein